MLNDFPTRPEGTAMPGTPHDSPRRQSAPAVADCVATLVLVLALTVSAVVFGAYVATLVIFGGSARNPGNPPVAPAPKKDDAPVRRPCPGPRCPYAPLAPC